MHDIEKLSHDLTLDEYSTAKALFTAIKSAGIPMSKSVAMCYRAGKMDARAEIRERKKARYSTKEPENAAQELPQETEQATSTTSLPEANTEPTAALDEEGSSNNE